MSAQPSSPLQLRLTRRHPLIGTEVRGLDLGRPLGAAEIAHLQAVWAEHPLLVFPEQSIDDAQQIAFARHFGDLEIHPSVAHRSSTHPEIYRVSNVDEQDRIMAPESNEWQYLELTWLWHSDSSFREVPSKGSILRGVEVPEAGGDTLFANMYEAYAALPAATRARIDGCRVAHSHDAVIARSRVLSSREDRGRYTELPPVSQPLVSVHPVTGRRALFLSPHTMIGVEGMAETESQALLDELIAHATQERFVYRHRWRAGDIIMWDNRCTMHAVMPYDSTRLRRIMHRTTIVGDGPPSAAA